MHVVMPPLPENEGDIPTVLNKRPTLESANNNFRSVSLTLEEGPEGTDTYQQSKARESIPAHSTQKVDENRLNRLLVACRKNKKQSTWENVCSDVEAEFFEIDLLFTKMDLPPYHYRKDKIYDLPLTSSDDIVDIETCYCREYLDHFIFPSVLLAIESMLAYAQKIRAFQCQAGLFNPMDYIVEFLYHHNPLHSERQLSITPLPGIPFVAQWLSKYPRPPYPKWLTMSCLEAAVIIQRAVRMWLARRKREELQTDKDRRMEMTRLKELEEQQGECGEYDYELSPLFGPYYDEIMGEGFDDEAILSTHSTHCFVCQRFRKFLQRQAQKPRKIRPRCR